MKGKLVPLETKVVKLRTGTHHRQRYSNQHDYKAKVPTAVQLINITKTMISSHWGYIASDPFTIPNLTIDEPQAADRKKVTKKNKGTWNLW